MHLLCLVQNANVPAAQGKKDTQRVGGAGDLAWRSYQMLWHCVQVSVGSACGLQQGIVLYVYLFI